MPKFYNKRKAGMKRAKSGKYYYPSKGKIIKKQKKWNKKNRVYRDPFPLQVRRRLTYAFRTTIQPPTTSLGGFSISKQTFLLNSCFDPDKTVPNTGLTGVSLKSSRINHQPMGFDQLMTLYRKYLVTYARVNVGFAFEHPTTYVNETLTDEGGPVTTTGTIRDNTPCRVGYVTSDGDDLPTSVLTTGGNLPTIEKLIEQSRSGQLNPKSSQFRYRTLMKDNHVKMSFGVNPFKFAKAKNGITWADYKGSNSALANQDPTKDPCYCHLFVSPLSITSGDAHTPVVVYGTIDFDVLASDLVSLNQS